MTKRYAFGPWINLDLNNTECPVTSDQVLGQVWMVKDSKEEAEALPVEPLTIWSWDLEGSNFFTAYRIAVEI